MAQQQQPQGTTGNSAAAATAPAQTQQTAQTAAQTGGSNEPVNLFEAAAAAQGSRGAGQGAGAGAGAAGGTTPGSGGAGGAGAPVNLDFMRDNPTFQQLRQLVQQQPQMLETVLQQVTASNPQLAQMIAAQPEAFMNLLMEGSGGEEGENPPLPPGAQAINVTEAERDAIERVSTNSPRSLVLLVNIIQLCRLGFERDLVIQAYFACDKNEELAANFLFENQNDDDM